ncbi:MAG: hypothetical protein H0W76_18050 [Pyrinomonadaceae bacterium]|nr:hypothetical protein [Pyrinomonadaceae bacterium]
MSTEVIIAIVVAGLMAAFLIFAVIRRTVRMALRLALFGVVVLMMAIGALVIWWYLPGDVTGNQNRPSSTRPARAR